MQDQDHEPKHRRKFLFFPGVIIIAVGVLFLIKNLGVNIPFVDNKNWWAWLILIAALAPLTRANALFREHGRVDAKVAHSLLTAASIVLVAVMFLLGLKWQVWWPLFVILGGLYAMTATAYKPERRDRCGR